MPRLHAFELLPDAAGCDAMLMDWLPHVALRRRIPQSEAAVALDALGDCEVELVLTELRRWDPDAGTVTTVARVSDPGLST